jgi:hypothetical protein
MLDCDQLLPILKWLRHKIHHTLNILRDVMPPSELNSLSLKYIAGESLKSAMSRGVLSC